MIEQFINQSASHITKQALGKLDRWTRADESTFYLHDLHSCVEYKVISDYIIRVRLAPGGTFLPDVSYAIQPYDFEPASIEILDQQDCLIIQTSQIRCKIIKENFRTLFLDLNDVIINEETVGLYWEENTDFGGYHLFSNKQIQENEHFYGLGDKACDLNLIHKRFTLWSTDAYAFGRGTDPLYRNYPFYMGLHHGLSYGIFYDNTFRTTFDFGHADRSRSIYHAEGGQLCYYYMAGPHMMDVTKRFAQLTGTAPMPPMWALGYHQCRWSYYPEAKLMDLARNFRERKIPCDALYLDIDYMDGYRCFTWNNTHFPDPKGMISRLKADGFRTVVIIDPGIKIDQNYPVFVEGSQKGYFCRRGDDYFMEGPVWPGRCQFPDFTNPQVREWWGTLFEQLLEEGVEGVWNDMNEPSVFGTGTFPLDVRHYLEGQRGSHRKAHNVYGMQMVRASYEGMRKLRPKKRPFTITRSAYAGTQRYAAAWTGDNVATWDHLFLANIQCQRMSMSGFSFCGSDIGGFTGSPTAELFVRWVQLGVFAPFMRAHSAGDTPEREPWSFGPEAEDICRSFIELRYRLLPYLYSAFWENHKYGFPILRPLIMVEQEVETNVYRQDEFMFGDKILACPMLEQGAVGRTVYLPKGKWYYYWDNQIFEGRQGEHWVAAPIEVLPLFVRAGSVIPEYPVMQYTQEFEIKELILRVYFADYQVNSFIYEDHGDSFAYEQNIYTEKKFLYEGDATHVRITQSEQGLYTPRYESYLINFIGLPFAFKQILADNKPIESFVQDAQTGIITFSVLKSFKVLEIV